MAAPQDREPLPLPCDAWGLPIIQPVPQPADDTLGWTTSDDELDGWEPTPCPPIDFLMAFAWYGYSRLRLLILWTGLHRWRR